MASGNVHRQVFFRRVRSGLRSALAALLACVLLLTDQIARQLTIAFFASITAIIVCDSSLGRTLRNCSMVLFAVVVSSVSSIVSVSLFGRSELAIILGMTATCALIAYPDIHVIRRKFGLAYTGITFIGFYVYSGISLTFPLRFGATALLGTQCAVIAMLLPTPLWATNLVRDCAELAARSMAALLATQLGAFRPLDGRTLAEAKTQAGMLRRAVVENVQSMREREEELWWEFAGGKPTAKIQRLLRVFDALLMHSASLDLALQSGHIQESPPLLFELLQDSLAEMASWAGAVLQTAVDDFRGRKGTLEETERLAAHGTDLLKRFNATLQAAREQVYYGIKSGAALPAAPPESALRSNEDARGHGVRRRRSRVETLMRCSVESLIASQFFLFHARNITQEAFTLLTENPSVTPSDQSNRRKSLLQSILPSQPAKPCQNPDCVSSVARLSHSETDADSAPLRGRAYGNKKRVTSVTGVDSEDPGRGAAAGNGKRGWWRSAVTVMKSVRLDGTRIKRSIRVAIAISVTGVIGIATDRVFPFLATATVGVLFGGYQGATFRTALNRFLGTVAGSMYGYIAIMLVHGHPVAVGALLVPWVAFVTFARYSKAYGYSSVVSAFTAAIIMLGYRSSHEGIKEYALGRITQTWIGIIAFVVVETCLWPSRAAALLRGALVASLQDARACFAAVVRSYMEDECPQCRQRAVDQVAAAEKRCAALIQKQGPLIDEAAAEPDLWRAPFFAQGYVRLVDLQKRVTLLLYAMDCSLRATAKDASGEHSEKLVRPLQGPLRTLEAEVLLTLDASIAELQRAQDTESQPSKAERAEEIRPAADAEHANGLPDARTCIREKPGLLRSDETGNESQNQADVRKAGRNHYGSVKSAGTSVVDPSENGPAEQRSSGDSEVFQYPLPSIDADGSRSPRKGGSIQKVLREFEHRYEDVISGLISAKLAHPDSRIVDNSAMLSFNALVFSMRALIAEASQLGDAVRELLQVERPMDLAKCLSPRYHPPPTISPLEAASS